MDADSPNQKTLRSYEAHAQEYIDGVPAETPELVRRLLGQALRRFPKDARILEIGSGPGRDAQFIQDLGYKVDCTDAVQAFVDVLKKKGLPARKLNVITDPLEGVYDIILATGVFLHFTREETKKVIAKVLAALRPGGVLVCTLRYGSGDRWKHNKVNAPRYFCYWKTTEIKRLLKATGFSTVQVERGSEKWLQITARR